MDCNKRTIFWYSRNRRLASVIVTSICLACCIPQNGFCIPDGIAIETTASNIVNVLQARDEMALLGKFDEIDRSFESSSDSYESGLKFLEFFIHEINIHYGMQLSLNDACQLVKGNLHILNIPYEHKESLLQTIVLIEIANQPIPPQEQTSTNTMSSDSHHWHIYPPWKWNWFGLNKQKHKENNNVSNSVDFPGGIPPDDGLPGNIPLGACELFAGALIFILPFGEWAGSLMMADGARRLIDGAVQLSDERRDPNKIGPNFPKN